jgi:3-deoxy-D-manno-octulosonic-acid transferase
MATDSAFKLALGLYESLWRPAAPLLRHNRRLAEGYAQRCLKAPLPLPAELWIQAASVGESYLAWELLKHLQPPHPIRVLLTTNTAQGLQILNAAVADIGGDSGRLTACVGYFPFDRPSWMRRVVESIRPRLAVLLETELWPGQLCALKRFGSRVLIVNGRMSAASLRSYRIWPAFWRRLAPDAILAISTTDAQRFSAVFPQAQVEVVPNIKFDRLRFDPGPTDGSNPVARLFAPQSPVLVLGSIRQEEESQIQALLLDLHARLPECVICLFPRHQPRQAAWADFLDRSRLPWTLRSKIEEPVAAGSVVLWDTFGELSHAYQIARAAFVGGSLAPLGGQNFLEPLVSGIRPVIGPWWESFHWVGSDIVDSGLVRVARNWEEAADRLARDITSPPDPQQTRRRAQNYVQKRQGGTAASCRRIAAMLAVSPP